MGRAERQRRRAAARAWRAVPVRERLAATRAAKRGEQHPDPVVAATALELARASPSARELRWSSAITLLAALVLTAQAVLYEAVPPVLLAVLFAGVSLYLWDLQRDLRAIRAAAGDATGPGGVSSR